MFQKHTRHHSAARTQALKFDPYNLPYFTNLQVISHIEEADRERRKKKRSCFNFISVQRVSAAVAFIGGLN